MSLISNDREPSSLSHAETMLPIKIPKSLRGRDDEKENVASAKYSKVVINLPGVEGTTVTTRRNTFHPTEAFLTPLKPLDRPAITSPRGKKTIDLPQVNFSSTSKSPLVRLQRLRELAQQRLQKDVSFESESSPLRGQAQLSSKTTETDQAGTVRNISAAEVIGSSPSRIVDSSVVEINGSRIKSIDVESERLENQNTNPILTSEASEIPDAMFSRSYVETLQLEHYDRIEELERVLSTKTNEIKRLHENYNDMQKDLADSEEKLVQQENLLGIAKDKVVMIEEELKYRTSEVASLKREVSHNESYKKELKESIVKLRKELDDEVTAGDFLRTEVKLLKEGQNQLEKTAKETEEKLIQSSSAIQDLQQENLKLVNALDDSEATARSLQRELNMSRTEVNDLTEEISRLQSTIEEQDRTQQLLNDKLRALMEETNTIHTEMATFEKEYKQIEEQLQKKADSVVSLESQIVPLRQKVEELEEARAAARNEATNLQQTNEVLLQEKQDMERENKILRNQHVEKDEIISGDTKKMSELVLEIDQLKKMLAAKTQAHEELNSERTSDFEAQQRINSLQQQIAHAQEKTDERIQEVAEQLYHQYSKKHEVKVGQLKKKFEAKLEETRNEIEAKRRKIETLERLLMAETKDKNHLLMLLEDKDLLRMR